MIKQANATRIRPLCLLIGFRSTACLLWSLCQFLCICDMCGLYPAVIRPLAQWYPAQQLDAADFATEEPPQVDDEDSFEEDHSANANDSVCIQCDDGGELMLRVLLCTIRSAHACASNCRLGCSPAVAGARRLLPPLPVVFC